MALKPLKPVGKPRVQKYPSFQLGKKPIMGAAVKKPLMYNPRSVRPRPDPAPGRDFGQNALYPGGYNQPKNPVTDWSKLYRGEYTTTGAGGSTVSPTPQVNPDYGSLIAGDWEVQDAEAAMAAQMARMRGDFQAGLRSKLIDLGLSDTSKLGSLGQYIDADTIKAAVANKYSATAQNAQQAERARAQNNAALAARGLLSSGQTTKSQEDVTAGQESANYAALRSFLEGGAQGLGAIADQEYQMARGVAAARAAAAQRAAELYQLGAGGGPQNPNLISPNESGFYDIRKVVGAPRIQPGAYITGKSHPQLTQQQFLRKNPRGNYYNYLRAWNRQYGNPNWGR